MNVFKKLLIVFVFSFLYNCDYGPKPIDYGNSACSFCQMNIVDKIHGAEIITTKGKVYVFDASECMIHYSSQFKGEIAHYFTNHYSQPGTLVDATQATFLISKNLPSPMGAYITAFKNEVIAKNIQLEKKGTLYSWEELKTYLKH